MFHNVITSLESYGYIAIFLVLFIESLGVPTPDEITLLFTGYLVSQGRINYLLAILIAAASATSGGVVAYFIAKKGGRAILLRFGRYVGLDEKKLFHTEQWFAKRGVWAVYFGRIVSGVRAFISYPAGLFEMPLRTFVLYSFFGAATWATLAITLGWILGPSWNLVGAWMAKQTGLVLGVAALLLLLGAAYLYFIKRRQPSRGS